MVFSRAILALAAVSYLAGAAPLMAQQQTVGLFVHDTRAQDGYNLFSPLDSTRSYLIDNGGLVVQSWDSAYTPGLMGYFSPDGLLVRAGQLPGSHPNFTNSAGWGGIIEAFGWDGSIVWDFTYWDDTHLAHHDIEVMPNGNVLLIAWDYKTRQEALLAGRNPGLLSLDLRAGHVIEIQPDGEGGATIVWEWHVWDHLIQDYSSAMDNFGVVQEHPELVDINWTGTAGPQDWTHLNGIAYNPELDQIVLSPRKFDELWVIDHSTTTAEAASHSGGNSGMGGDLLYRWGNPRTYRRGTEADQKLLGQHDVQWIEPGRPGEGNFLIFDNRRNLGQGSMVKEIAPPVDEFGNYAIESGEAFGPTDFVWVYPSVPDPDFYSPHIAGAQRQPGGTTLICEGTPGHLFEVTSDEEVVWDYVNPDTRNGVLTQGDPVSANRVFKVRRYPPDYPGLAGRDLTPGDPVESFTTPYPVPADSLVALGYSTVSDLVEIEWDADSCQSFDYNLIYGPLRDLPSYDSMSILCSIGTSGYFVWAGPPDDSIYFLIVSTDPTRVYESSWGLTSDGEQRHAARAAFQCDTTTKIVTARCP